ncbi:MAG: hypothetical protein ACOCUU_02450 [Nanoarchaeota archaeon]
MTTIISLYLNKRNQIMILSDTKHSYEDGPIEDTKIKIFNGILFCGAGNDDSIGQIHRKIKNQTNIDSCSEEIVKIKQDNKNSLLNETTKSAGENLMDTEFFIIDTKQIKGNKIRNININEVGDFEIIGSGIKRITDIQEIFRGYSERTFSDVTKKAFFREIISVFLNIAKFDQNTGHPSIFPIEVFILEKDKSPKKYVLKFDKELLKNPDNYDPKEEEIKND